MSQIGITNKNDLTNHLRINLINASVVKCFDFKCIIDLFVFHNKNTHNILNLKSNHSRLSWWYIACHPSKNGNENFFNAYFIPQIILLLLWNRGWRSLNYVCFHRQAFNWQSDQFSKLNCLSLDFLSMTYPYVQSSWLWLTNLNLLRIPYTFR